jgi:maltokinase
VVVGSCSTTAPPDFLHGHDASILGTSNNLLLFDAALDPELARVLLAVVAPGEDTKHVRPMGAEQSNTSLVFDDRLVLKMFRRVHDGPNPDIEVTAALGGVGFDHVAAPIAVWERDQRHLAVAQPFLAGASDGWALALTSLRDLYASDCEEPAECGGDFGAEAARLGHITAAMHVALARAFGFDTPDVDAWKSVMTNQLDRIASDKPWKGDASALFDTFASLAGAGAAVRVHGDYHLGQVVRTDSGWYVLDFEGEPARPLTERRLPSSPLKDVAGMLRSFSYAAAVALREREGSDIERLTPMADAWVAHNRRRFLAGYLATDGIAALLPGNDDDIETALRAWELDKAVYEVGYEMGHRPDWVEIPESAVQRILED